jgi:AraC family ethanolamine operon transcriptional activator
MKVDAFKETVCLNQLFQDFEHLAKAIRGWDVDFRQLDRGQFQANVTQVDTSAALVTEAVFNRRLDQKGGAPPRAWTFAILETRSPSLVWRGQIFTNTMMAVYPPGSEINASSPPNFHVLTLSIPVDVFEGWDALYRLDDSEKTQPICTLLGVDPSRMAAIRIAARRIIAAALSGRSSTHESEDDLPNQVVFALSHATSIVPKPYKQKRNRLLRVLTTYIDAHLKEPIPLTDLCAVANVSPRTIQYAFMDRFSVTPKQYITAHRLHGVRKDLVRSNFYHGNIADAANNWGFWHMGQFAADYKRLFDELPSETIQRKYRQ